MAGKPLTEFLLSLTDDETLTRFNNRDVASADRYLADEIGLDDAQRAAVLSRDVSAIYQQLTLEGATDDFFVPAGPTMAGPARFKASPQGTMDPPPIRAARSPGTMDPGAFAARRDAAGTGRGAPPSARRKPAAKRAARQAPARAAVKPTRKPAAKAKSAKGARKAKATSSKTAGTRRRQK
jgi:hypothetical protein